LSAELLEQGALFIVNLSWQLFTGQFIAYHYPENLTFSHLTFFNFFPVDDLKKRLA
jgi:hypothetical protein